MDLIKMLEDSCDSLGDASSSTSTGYSSAIDSPHFDLEEFLQHQSDNSASQSPVYADSGYDAPTVSATSSWIDVEQLDPNIAVKDFQHLPNSESNHWNSGYVNTLQENVGTTEFGTVLPSFAHFTNGSVQSLSSNSLDNSYPVKVDLTTRNAVEHAELDNTQVVVTPNAISIDNSALQSWTRHLHYVASNALNYPQTEVYQDNHFGSVHSMATNEINHHSSVIDIDQYQRESHQQLVEQPSNNYHIPSTMQPVQIITMTILPDSTFNVNNLSEQLPNTEAQDTNTPTTLHQVQPPLLIAKPKSKRIRSPEPQETGHEFVEDAQLGTLRAVRREPPTKPTRGRKPQPIRYEMASEHYCLPCKKNFRSKGGLVQHNRYVHPETARLHRCEECGKKFETLEKLTNHSARHKQGKDFKCGLCEKDFNHMCDLRRHYVSIHERGEKLFRCRFCGKCFGRQDHCRKHEVGHKNRTVKRSNEVTGLQPMGNEVAKDEEGGGVVEADLSLDSSGIEKDRTVSDDLKVVL
ncbi:fez family zinc finger protein erm-like [Uranotaenia lowii]|uniref:fez family zinc finger protein erm-like n=1 Tax=Uranotaenia lowii TaxID=190385 RepID=UPI00247991ED|nr:fez family zinc finger protein erm-like [Uranotaenia lowii]